MHAVIRTYSGAGARELFDALEARKSEVENLMVPIEGFVSYMLARTADGGTTVTVCQDQRGCRESSERARNWIAANASDTGVASPTVSEGSVIEYFNA